MIPVPPLEVGRVLDTSADDRSTGEEEITPLMLACNIPVERSEKVICPDEVKPVAPVMGPALVIPPPWLLMP